MAYEEGDITVVEVKRYAYCPRIVFITHVLHHEEVLSEAMKMGLELHEENAISPLIVKLKALRVLRSLELRSEELGLVGKLDYLVVTRMKEYVPVEVKWAESSKGRVKRDHKLQLAAYALLIDENFKTSVKRGYVYYLKDKKVAELPIDQGLKNLARKVVKRIHLMILNEEDPGVKMPMSKCIGCGYRAYCRPG
ncbi:MAG: CRISPR-associated protein Cas4 [Nitrososphaerota archaeon]|nr:CRISPR-associated protein Cas4 [Aigarchaeota archaeon]MDW8077118.1 CRISPR-associated protein Cas4 [Nitrososphaerota archaeon]